MARQQMMTWGGAAPADVDVQALDAQVVDVVRRVAITFAEPPFSRVTPMDRLLRILVLTGASALLAAGCDGADGPLPSGAGGSGGQPPSSDNSGSGAGDGVGGGGGADQGEPSIAVKLLSNGYLQDQYGRIYNVFQYSELTTSHVVPIHLGALVPLEKSETDLSWFCGTRPANEQLECWGSAQMHSVHPELFEVAPENIQGIRGVFIRTGNAVGVVTHRETGQVTWATTADGPEQEWSSLGEVDHLIRGSESSVFFIADDGTFRRCGNEGCSEEVPAALAGVAWRSIPELAGPNYGCGITMDGALKCWRADEVVVDSAGPYTTVLMSSGGTAPCALAEAGDVECFAGVVADDGEYVPVASEGPYIALGLGGRVGEGQYAYRALDAEGLIVDIGADGVVDEFSTRGALEVPLASCLDDLGVCSEIYDYEDASEAEYTSLCVAEGGTFSTDSCGKRALKPLRGSCTGLSFQIEGKGMRGGAFFFGDAVSCEQAQAACQAEADGNFACTRP